MFCFMSSSVTFPAKTSMDIYLVSTCQTFQHPSSWSPAKSARYDCGKFGFMSAHSSSVGWRMSSQVMAALMALQARS